MITRGSEKSFQNYIIKKLKERFPIRFQVLDGCKQKGIPDALYSINRKKGSGFT